MRISPLLRENLKIAIASIRSNILRTVLTILIIALGIMALVGILTAIESIKKSVTDNFSQMGILSFSISRQTDRFRVSNQRNRQRGHEHVSYKQAVDFKYAFEFPAYVSINTTITGSATIKYESEKTNPNIRVIGADEVYLTINSLEIDKGRNFSVNDVEYGVNVAIIGQDVVKSLFKDKRNPIIGQDINVSGVKYRVIGTLKGQGASFGRGPDGSVLIPVNNARIYFPRPNQNYRIQVQPYAANRYDLATSQAEGLFRLIRRNLPSDPSDFQIIRSDANAQEMLKMLGYVSIAAYFIGGITLLGAAVGLMNIMLVSVNERTREIGTRKAIGAKSQTIKQQFLFEAILIGQLGGFLGVIAGIIIGNVISLFTGGVFVIPWIWMFLGVTLCFIVSIASGYLPAVKASRLDPIEALRYE